MKFITFAGLVGGYFVVWKLAQTYKNAAHRKDFERDLERGKAAVVDAITKQAYEKQAYASSSGERLLSVSAFSVDNLDVSRREQAPSIVERAKWTAAMHTCEAPFLHLRLLLLFSFAGCSRSFQQHAMRKIWIKFLLPMGLGV